MLSFEFRLEFPLTAMIRRGFARIALAASRIGGGQLSKSQPLYPLAFNNRHYEWHVNRSHGVFRMVFLLETYRRNMWIRDRQVFLIRVNRCSNEQTGSGSLRFWRVAAFAHAVVKQSLPMQKRQTSRQVLR